MARTLFSYSLVVITVVTTGAFARATFSQKLLSRKMAAGTILEALPFLKL